MPSEQHDFACVARSMYRPATYTGAHAYSTTTSTMVTRLLTPAVNRGGVASRSANELAIIRTELASQRTFLAHVRTALGLAAFCSYMGASSSSVEKSIQATVVIAMLVLSAVGYICEMKRAGNERKSTSNANAAAVLLVPFAYVALTIHTFYIFSHAEEGGVSETR